MGKNAFRTIFYAIFGDFIISSAIFNIKKRTKAKKTIKIALIHIFMANKKFAVAIAEVGLAILGHNYS